MITTRMDGMHVVFGVCLFYLTLLGEREGGGGERARKGRRGGESYRAPS